MQRDLFGQIAEIFARTTEVREDAKLAPTKPAPQGAEIVGRMPPHLQHLFLFFHEEVQALETATTYEDIELGQRRVRIVKSLLALSIEQCHRPRLTDETGKQLSSVEIGVAQGWRIYHLYGKPVSLNEIPHLVIVSGEAFVEQEPDHGISARRAYEAFVGIPHQRRKPFDVH